MKFIGPGRSPICFPFSFYSNQSGFHLTSDRYEYILSFARHFHQLRKLGLAFAQCFYHVTIVVSLRPSCNSGVFPFGSLFHKQKGYFTEKKNNSTLNLNYKLQITNCRFQIRGQRCWICNLKFVIWKSNQWLDYLLCNFQGEPGRGCGNSFKDRKPAFQLNV